MPATRRRPRGRVRITTFGRALLLVAFVGASFARGGEPVLIAVATLLIVVLGVVSVVWPFVTVARARVTMTGPTDATVGDPVVHTVVGERLGDGVEVRLVDPAGPWAPLVGRRGRATAEVERVASTRGVFVGVRVEVRASGALGLVERIRPRLLTLPHPMAVAPRARPMELDAADGSTDPSGDAMTTAVSDAETIVRSVRPYAPGDPPRLVHWATSARLGELVVRELEPVALRRVAVLADLSDGGPTAERVASTVAGVVAAALAEQVEVLLITAEDGRAVVGRVTTPLATGRRLARATPGAMAAVPPGWDPLDIRAWVHQEAGTVAGPLPVGAS